MMCAFSTTSTLYLSSHRHLRAAPVVIVFLMCFILFAESFMAGFPRCTSRVVVRARSEYFPPVEFLTQDIPVTASGNLRFAPSTLYYMGSNKVSFRGVSTQKDMAHNRCIVVGEDRIVYQNVTGARKTLMPPLYLKKCADDDQNITVIPASTQIPADLQLTLKRIEYKLRPAEPCTIRTFNKKLNSFLKTLPVINITQYFNEPFQFDSRTEV